jgi:hypothetical protein
VGKVTGKVKAPPVGSDPYPPSLSRGSNRLRRDYDNISPISFVLEFLMTSHDFFIHAMAGTGNGATARTIGKTLDTDNHFPIRATAPALDPTLVQTPSAGYEQAYLD